ncbi:palmitoyl-protein thioesterase ABHD10, mitochondrial isoform 2-T2 [Glossophaga mutica]
MAGVGMVASGPWDLCWRWGLTAVSFGFHRGLSGVLARRSDRVPRWLPESRMDLAQRRFDYSGVGNSDGNFQECTVGRWRKDVLSIIDELAEGPQILVGSSLGGWLMLHAAIARPQKVVALIGVAAAVDGLVTKFNQLPVEVKKEIEMKGVWSMPSKYNKDGVYHIQYSFIKEAEHHCLLHSPIPVNCPLRLLHGMKDDAVPWHTSLQVADRVVSTDVDVILRKHSDHRMKEKADIQLLVYTIDDLIDKLSTAAN